MKVKLQNSAPAPSREDLAHYREAIEEQVRALAPWCGKGDQVMTLSKMLGENLMKFMVGHSCDIHGENPSVFVSNQAANQFTKPQERS